LTPVGLIRATRQYLEIPREKQHFQRSTQLLLSPNPVFQPNRDTRMRRALGN
jgi:hypothetical protein